MDVWFIHFFIYFSVYVNITELFFMLKEISVLLLAMRWRNVSYLSYSLHPGTLCSSWAK